MIIILGSIPSKLVKSQFEEFQAIVKSFEELESSKVRNLYTADQTRQIMFVKSKIKNLDILASVDEGFDKIIDTFISNLKNSTLYKVTLSFIEKYQSNQPLEGVDIETLFKRLLNNINLVTK